MKLGTVIGRVTLSKSVDLLKGGRFSSSARSAANNTRRASRRRGHGQGPSLVVYDDLGGGVGEVIGYEEGAKPRSRLRCRSPIDAINARWWTRCFTTRGKADLQWWPSDHRKKTNNEKYLYEPSYQCP
jgi:microcompartment protein CcmK/EutM